MGMFKLDNATNGIIVPSTVNDIIDGKKITRKATKAEITYALLQAKICLSMFGGYTIYNAVGGWLDSDTQELVEEKIAYVWAYGECKPIQRIRLETTARLIGKYMKQDSILTVINGQVYLID